MSAVITTLLQGAVLLATLNQTVTNGWSSLGTLQAPKLPDFLTNNPLPNGYPWGTKTASNTNYYTQSPVTGVTRSYDFTITRAFKAPDGFNKSMLLVNGQFPGPTIEANWGDTIQVTVHNQITGPAEGTSMHWHGLLQTGTPWYDGVPSVGQCPIAPGKSFTYTFNADLYGTTWYHSHYSSQYADGISGPMIIHGPKNAAYDIDLGPVLLSDWYHTGYLTLVEGVVGTNAALTRPASDNNLINGKMDFDCTIAPAGSQCTPHAGISKFNFTTGKTHRIRLVNAGVEGLQRFSIDNHTMTVVANDMVPIQPYNTQSVTLGVGQRTDVLVKATGQPTDGVWMRANISGSCSSPTQSQALAAVYYPQANTTMRPNSTAWHVDDSSCGNDPLSSTVPYYPITPDPNPATTQTLVMNFGVSASGNYEWMMNGSSFRADFDYALLSLANQGNVSYPADPRWNVYNFGSNHTIRLIVNNLIPAAHPMHMHGHNMYVLAEGTGTWDGTVVNPSNPARRDTQMVQGLGYMVFQIDANNPGVWPFHCHIAWHASAGLYVNILERPADIVNYRIPSTINQTCIDWASFTSQNAFNEYDSGV